MSDTLARVSLPVQVRDALAEAMRLDGLGPGDQAPTEAQTATRFGVSRSTAREALRLLEQDGVVRIERGKGRFLSSASTLRVERPVDRFESVTEMLEALGHRVTSAVLAVGEHPADGTEAEALGLRPDSPVLRLVRIRFGDDRPLLYTVDTVPRECLPGPVEHRDWSGSLTSALALHGHAVESSAARIRAAELPPGVEAAHALGGLGPWLLVEETCVSRAGRRVLFAQDYHRGHDIAFHVVRRR
jgi:GntR family transcriptional regulator